MTKTVANKNGIAYIDLAAQVPKNIEYFTDDVHYTEKGNAKISETLFDLIVKNNYIEE